MQKNLLGKFAFVCIYNIASLQNVQIDCTQKCGNNTLEIISIRTNQLGWCDTRHYYFNPDDCAIASS